MWGWFFCGYAVFVALLVSYAAHVALSGSSPGRRADAYRVLRLIWAGATGTGGLATAAVRLHEAGLL
ncbi:hypothetical protein [Saccharothrix coeruleofusca]|uniref:Uncharacterized protein n=1 Tax=Saccharothrix coeruleofusca TaxID=33919 RepID=A0A918ANU5_9PSEU|nr:hypothetical protein [Saccharothrix coeruleofusca]MBP2337871.1 hypothetical protein [Saccharothrix coeruleofusca]GGP62826.1 hypothetical protein GCM10010185_39170 [Saccharothrix coeruleofusca]